MTQESRQERIPVEFVSEFFPHYRQSLVEALGKDPTLEARWVSQATSIKDHGIPSARLPKKAWVETRISQLPLGLAWQAHIFWRALRHTSRVYVFTGDPRFLSTWLSVPIARLRGAKVLFWTHGWTRPDNRWRGSVKKVFFSLSDGLLLYSDEGKALGEASGFSRSMYVIYNSMGAPLTSGQVTATSGPSRSQHQRWIVVSRLIEGRDLDHVIKQAGRLRRMGKSVEVDIIGEGPLADSLQRLAREMQVPARFRGAIYDQDETAALLARSDALLSPGNVGLAAVHALSAGCPVVTHDDAFRQMPEHTAVVHGVTGIKFPYGNFDAMGDMTWDFVATTDRSMVIDACHREILRRWSPESQAVRIVEAVTNQVS